MESSSDGNRLIRLQNVVELWYVWLSSAPAVLCSETDMERMGAAVRALRETGDFMEKSAIVKAEWFLNEGSGWIMERIRKNAYDCYE
ncbi:hypothetical protein [Paenibacillus daejeonensis]|uniref:hypothetical protein n=1 Tax=Paenibacillus daejeonensis TaxID=135193 RepID=UPI00035F475A|nr:hypothetical protein [Paenibacillus daejeonensis]